MPNRELDKILDKVSKEELVERVKVRLEGDHFRVTSGRGWHTIRYAPDGTPYCSCEDWTFNEGKKPIQERCCKHLAAMAKMGVIVLKPGQKEAWSAREYSETREKAE
jgi:hypothetical protein